MKPIGKTKMKKKPNLLDYFSFLPPKVFTAAFSTFHS